MTVLSGADLFPLRVSD